MVCPGEHILLLSGSFAKRLTCPLRDFSLFLVFFFPLLLSLSFFYSCQTTTAAIGGPKGGGGGTQAALDGRLVGGESRPKVRHGTDKRGRLAALFPEHYSKFVFQMRVEVLETRTLTLADEMEEEEEKIKSGAIKWL